MDKTNITELRPRVNYMDALQDQLRKRERAGRLEREGWRTDPRWRRLALQKVRQARIEQSCGDNTKLYRGRNALAEVDQLWQRMIHESVQPFHEGIDCCDPAAASARYLAATGGKSCVFTLAEMKRWRIDRSGGVLRLAKPKTRAHGAKSGPGGESRQTAPDHSALIRELLAWIDGRACDPGIVARAARAVGLPAEVHAHARA